MAFADTDIILEQAGVRQVVSTDKAPAAIGPYSQAIKAGDFLYASGQIPVNPATGDIPNTIEGQAKQSLENVKALVEAAGYTLADVVKTTVFAADMADFGKINAVYAEYFPKEAPARSFVAVKELPKGVGLEIEVVAWRKKQ